MLKCQWHVVCLTHVPWMLDTDTTLYLLCCDAIEKFFRKSKISSIVWFYREKYAFTITNKRNGIIQTTLTIPIEIFVLAFNFFILATSLWTLNLNKEIEIFLLFLLEIVQFMTTTTTDERMKWKHENIKFDTWIRAFQFANVQC